MNIKKIELTVEACTTIKQAVDTAIELAKKYNCPVDFYFNLKHVIVNKNTSHNAGCNQYYSHM